LAAGLNGAGFASGVAGTHRYMAPETALYGQSDPSSDSFRAAERMLCVHSVTLR
jgi:hypothetical protein